MSVYLLCFDLKFLLHLHECVLLCVPSYASLVFMHVSKQVFRKFWDEWCPKLHMMFTWEKSASAAETDYVQKTRRITLKQFFGWQMDQYNTFVVHSWTLPHVYTACTHAVCTFLGAYMCVKIDHVLSVCNICVLVCVRIVKHAYSHHPMLLHCNMSLTSCVAYVWVCVFAT